MNQSQIVRNLVEANEGITFREMHLAVSNLVAYMESALVADKRFEIRGFGVLQNRKNEARRSRNPRNEETIYIESRRYGHFKPGRELLQALNPDKG